MLLLTQCVIYSMVGCHSFQMAVLLVIFLLLFFYLSHFIAVNTTNRTLFGLQTNHERFDSITGVNLYQMQQIRFRFCVGQSVGC